MALDWSKEISFSGLRKSRPKAKAEYPSKTYINLVTRDKRSIDVRKSVPAIVLLVLAVVLVCKFGIYDFYDRVNQKQAELNSQAHVLSELEARLVDYDAVKAEYETYESSKLVANDETVSSVDALALVDSLVAPAAHIDSISQEGNTVSLNLSRITLKGVGQLVSTLYDSPLVADVSVSTAATDQSEAAETTAAVVITLHKA